MFVSIHLPASAAEVEFVAAPAPYYYLRPGGWCVIPCHGTLQEPANEEQGLAEEQRSPAEHSPGLTLNATFYRNGTTLTSTTLPGDHHLVIDDLENVVGLILSAASQDSHTTYHCVVAGLASLPALVYVAGKTITMPW